jgi:outer membrane protein OmpA-like peptidoglycan-associated protein
MKKSARTPTKVVAPHLSDGATSIIYGHTDMLGNELYNQKLSVERAKGVQEILEKYLKDKPSIKVNYVTLGFGEQDLYAPFENKYPEERFYNRSVIIDILPVN